MHTRLLDDFAEMACDWFWEMDGALRFSYFSDRLGEVSGVDPRLEIGRSRLDIAANATDPEFWRPHVADLLAHRPFRNFIYPYRRRDGQTRWFRISGSPHFGADGGFEGYRGVGTDVTAEREARDALAATMAELRAANAELGRHNDALRESNARLAEEIARRERLEVELRRNAVTDALTGLANRVLLRERLDEVLDRVRNDAARHAAVLCVDLDGFKPVNDAHGHAVGDALLQAVAARLRASMRSGDSTLARVGGDEFTIVLGGRLRPDDAFALGKRLVAALARPFGIEGRTLRIGASIGIAVAPGNGTTTDVLLRRADEALYAAKAAGRGTCRLASSSSEPFAATPRKVPALA